MDHVGQVDHESKDDEQQGNRSTLQSSDQLFELGGRQRRNPDQNNEDRGQCPHGTQTRTQKDDRSGVLEDRDRSRMG